MTRQWRWRGHEYLLMLIFIQTVWTLGRDRSDTSRKLNGFPNNLNSNGLKGGSYVEIVIGTSADADTLQYYLSRWNQSEATAQDDTTYYGEGLQDMFFHSSAENNSQIPEDLSRCMRDFRFITCLKLLLVKKLDNLLDYVNDNNLTNTDLSFGNFVNFKSVPGVNGYEGRASAALGLDEDITRKIMELFKDRSLHLNLLPGLGLDLKPLPGETPGDFIAFKARPYFNWRFWRNDAEGESGTARKNKGGFKMPNLMILPQLIMWGFMPFALANLQAMVMNAFMINMMALNSAVFMTIRNLVFGPRGGPKIKYVNYGYRKKKKSNVPTVIVHSPAAFVKQPFHLVRRHKKPIHPPVKPPPHHHHHEPAIHHNDIPEAVSENFQGETYEELPEFHQGVEVFNEEGQLDGKNRVRIRINENEGPSVKEVLHRIREIEKHGNRFKPSVQYDYQEDSHTGYSEAIPSGFDSSSADNIPWNVPDPSASHTYGDIHSSQRESEDYVISNDKNQFTSMVT